MRADIGKLIADLGSLFDTVSHVYVVLAIVAAIVIGVLAVRAFRNP